MHNNVRRINNSTNQNNLEVKERLTSYAYQRFVKLGTTGGSMNYLDLATGSELQREHVITALDGKHKQLTGQHNYSLASDVLKYAHLRPVVAKEVRFKPNSGPIVQEYGLYYVNTWRRPSVEPCETDSELYKPQPFKDFISQAVGSENADYLLIQLALLVQHPLPSKENPKRPIALCLYSQHQGQGKSTLARIMQQILGRTAVNVIAGTKPLLDQNAVELFGRTLLVCEEADIGNNTKLYDRLKQFITEDSTMDALKNSSIREHQTPAHLMMISNRPPSFLDEHDRRFLVLTWDTGLRGEEKDDYFNGFNAWLNSGGYSSILTYLLNYDTSNYDYAAPAPMTAAKAEVLSSFGSGFMSDFKDYVEDTSAITITTDNLEVTRLADLYNLKSEELEAHMFKAGWMRSNRITVNGVKTRIWYNRDYKLKYGKGIKASLQGSDGWVRTVEDCLDDREDFMLL